MGKPYRLLFCYYPHQCFQIVVSWRSKQVTQEHPELLNRVVAHKERFFRSAWARYDLASPATLQLQPSEAWRDYLHKDYEKMKVMLFGEVPIFEEILAGLQNLETDIRKMGQETQSD